MEFLKECTTAHLEKLRLQFEAEEKKRLEDMKKTKEQAKAKDATKVGTTKKAEPTEAYPVSAK